MVKKKSSKPKADAKGQARPTIYSPSQTQDISLVKFSEQAISEYGSYVIENRALADIRDGLKPVHRRILWAMYRLGLSSKGATKKSARVVGECFAAGTPVATPDGERAIEDLAVGDFVTTRFGPKPVVERYYLPPQPVYTLELVNGKHVTATAGQEFLALRNGQEVWTKLSDLRPGDKILTTE